MIFYLRQAFLWLAVGFWAAFAGGATAQNQVFVQVEAQPTLAEAESRVRAYAAAFPNVTGFRMTSGWYAIALGPYTRDAATQELIALRRNRLIPSDSFIAFSRDYAQQFWPIGGQVARAQQAVTTGPLPTVVAPTPEPALPDETPRQARASESRLDRTSRELIQEALQFEGHYTSTIDGAFGPGTRNAMAAYQQAQGFEVTGILTTQQRRTLLEDYRGAFDGLGLVQLTDDEAGIQMTAPLDQVRFDKVEPPFVHYDTSGDRGLEMYLISQSGDQATLWGLYDIMQTLEIVPPEGFRERKNSSFVLTGQDSRRHSYTYAVQAGGAVKGFTLVWQPKDAKVMTRVVEQMRDSFTALPDAVLPDTAGSGSAQAIDLMAGLELRRPERSRSGFFVDASGAVLTTTDLLGQCQRVTVGEEIEMQVSAQDAETGLALLTPQSQALAPISFARFASAIPRLQSEVAVAGYSYEHVLNQPVLTYGRLADIRGLQGEEGVQRLEISLLPGDSGGPLFDRSGAVLGMALPQTDAGGRQLPGDVSFAADVTSIASFLSNAGLQPTATAEAQPMAPEDLTILAADMTVLVSCWN